MNIWVDVDVDVDACPQVIKDILFRAAERCQIPVTLVANQPLPTPPSRFIKSIQVRSGFDVADRAILDKIAAGDLVITSDIPLAAAAIDRGGRALSHRGELFTTENVRARLNVRDFMDTLRASGINTGGPPALSQSDRKAFAGHLDKLLASAPRDFGSPDQSG